MSDPVDAVADHDRALRDARARVEELFLQLNTLTPDELGRVGLLRAPDQRAERLATVDTAARATGREALVAEARREAGDIVMRRYADGTYRPTWIALNWGLSGGTVEDRVAVAEAVADAAAVAAVEDVLDPETAEALTIDARQVLDLAAGSASDGSLARALREPADPTLRRSPMRRRVLLLAVAVVAVLISFAGFGVGTVQAAVGGLVLAALAIMVVYWLLARSSSR
jgi:hypothetical protein